HQLFRRYDGVSLGLNLSLLLLPPVSLVSAIAATSPFLTLTRACILVLPTYVASLVLSTLIYRLSPFHPLAQYPGPLGCKLTKFRMAFLGATGRQHVYIQHLHERYASDIVRIGPNELSIRDPTAVPAVLGPSGVNRKGPYMKGMLLKAEPLTMIAIQDTDEHVQRRRSWQRGLSQAALKDYEVMVSRRARMLVDRLGESKGAEVCLDEWFDRFS
ncbi:uncharacterized protein BXZ73DRAFT_43320, partial [Epithele typhae]|uniref:uncharacterized protein n=1 Tax=Epithele typhae TaxID=378194 RepID=UPI0020087213